MTNFDSRAIQLAAAHVRRGGTVHVRVVGISMLPLLRPGDEIIVAPLRPEGPQVGEVLMVVNRRGLLTHRVVARKATTVYTRGDNATGDDPPNALSDVVGRVVGRVRGGQRLGLATPVWARVGKLVARVGRRGRAGRVVAKALVRVALVRHSTSITTFRA
jgi:signal peptidase I